MTTLSAPAGMGAPVKIRMAVPEATAVVVALPAASVPTSRSRIGALSLALVVSPARTA